MTDPEMLSWLRAAITERLELAREACDGDSGAWFMGRKWNVYRAEDENPFGGEEENRLVAWGNIKVQSLHIAANDPRQVIADCEADLAILDEYAKAVRIAGTYKDGDGLLALAEAKTWSDAVRLVAAGYRHQPGWKAEWAS